MGRQGRRRYKQLLDVFKGMRGYWKLEEGAVDCILENWLWKKLWTCLKTDYRMNDHLVSVYSLLKGFRKGVDDRGPLTYNSVHVAHLLQSFKHINFLRH
jgi:hypothetical protein